MDPEARLRPAVHPSGVRECRSYPAESLGDFPQTRRDASTSESVGMPVSGNYSDNIERDLFLARTVRERRPLNVVCDGSARRARTRAALTSGTRPFVRGSGVGSGAS